MIGLTKSAALQVASENISINALATAGFDIPESLFIGWLNSHSTSRAEAANWFPIRRFGRPEEIAAAALYLASDEARFAVGTVLVLDGGFTQRPLPRASARPNHK